VLIIGTDIGWGCKRAASLSLDCSGFKPFGNRWRALGFRAVIRRRALGRAGAVPYHDAMGDRTAIHADRIRRLNDAPERGDGSYVLYWMQQAQRAHGNHALEHAIREANRRDLTLIVGFGLMDDYPEANERHYAFMLEGLADVDAALRERRIKFVVRRGAPDAVAAALARDAVLVVCDRGYLRHQKAWRRRVAEDAECRVVEVESDVVVPVEIASDKPEFAARTLRPRIHRVWDRFLAPLDEAAPVKDSRFLRVKGDIEPSDLAGTLARLKLDRSVGAVRRFRGGTSEARRRLAAFVRGPLDDYGAGRNEPADFVCSLLSPYLHFGQISPLEVALAARDAGDVDDEDRATYLEELIVRRELAMNFVHFERRYDEYACLPDWARRTLDEHRGDRRVHLYDVERLEMADTHDRYWNAAMREMTRTGFMHNYMRMYWGKKILEWSASPEQAYRTTLALNNRWFLDGRDANSYANVGWIFGLHDRPWAERPVFGKVRFMNDRGLERKFDMPRYLTTIDHLAAEEKREHSRFPEQGTF